MNMIKEDMKYELDYLLKVGMISERSYLEIMDKSLNTGQRPIEIFIDDSYLNEQEINKEYN